MCGIVGYIGTRAAAPILVEGLKRLEYRGYDSAGVAVITQAHDCVVPARLAVVKEVGKVAALDIKAAGLPRDGGMGIGHTRWATHGEPSEKNAHPQLSTDGSIAVVHNGIIENHESLRAKLITEGVEFSSGTDTEVIPHLIARELAHGVQTLEDAVAYTLGYYVGGAYAIAVVSSQFPDEIVVACNSSPLVIGMGKDEGELFLASDEAAFSGEVKHLVRLEDGEVATLRRGGSYSFRGLPDVSSRIEKPGVKLEEIQKGGHTHFMHKEIHEQPQAVRNALAGRFHEEDGRVTFGGIITDLEARLKDARRIIFVACGTSLNAAFDGKLVIEGLARKPVEVEQASEFRYRDPILSSSDVVIGISQSGETADTLLAMEHAKHKHALCLGLTNRVGSTLSRKVQAGIYLHAGPEIAVASTKAFTSQVTVLTLLAIFLAKKKPSDVLLRVINRLPEYVGYMLGQEDEVVRLAQKYKEARRIMVLGRGYGVPLALEAALKIKEVSYIDAYGCSAAELKHGPLALVEKGTPVIALIPQDEALRSKMLSNLAEVRTRGGEVVTVGSDSEAQTLQSSFDEHVPASYVPDELMPIVFAPLLQLFAYHLGVARGNDVDQPRNLAKSVTVE